MRAEAIRGDLTSGALDPRSPHPDRAAYRASRGGGAAWTVAREISGCDPSSCGAAPGELGDEAGLAALRAELPASRGEVAALREAEDAYSVSVLLETGDDRLAWADFSVPRVSWREWWAGVESTLDGAAIHAVARADAALPLPARPGTGEGLALDGGAIEDAVAASGATAIPANMWANSTLDDPPAPRAEHSAVWTGTEFLVWGGYASRLPTNTGARYEPLTDTWRSTSTLGAPVARARHTAVWTGSVMLVWGGVGLNGVFRLQSGGRYDPSLDRWLPTSETGAPSARDSHAAAWTRSRMLVWGGWTGHSRIPCGPTPGRSTTGWPTPGSRWRPPARRRRGPDSARCGPAPGFSCGAERTEPRCSTTGGATTRQPTPGRASPGSAHRRHAMVTRRRGTLRPRRQPVAPAVRRELPERSRVAFGRLDRDVHGPLGGPWRGWGAARLRGAVRPCRGRVDTDARILRSGPPRGARCGLDRDFDDRLGR